MSTCSVKTSNTLVGACDGAPEVCVARFLPPSALTMPTEAEAIAAGKAMEAADDPMFFDPTTMRGISWDDICEDMEGEELENMENAIAAYEAHPGAYIGGSDAAYLFHGLLKLAEEKTSGQASGSKTEAKRPADAAGDEGEDAKKQRPGTAQGEADKEEQSYSATYHDMEQPWVKLPLKAWVKLLDASAAEDEEKQFPPIWAELHQVSETVQTLSPRLLLIGLLEWPDAAKAGRFLASCPWPATTSIAEAPSRGWQPSQPTNQGGLADYLTLIVCLRPPLDTEAMKRAGTIIGAAWEPWTSTARLRFPKQMIRLGSKASDGLSRWNHEKIWPSSMRRFVYDDGSLDDDDD